MSRPAVRHLISAVACRTSPRAEAALTRQLNTDASPPSAARHDPEAKPQADKAEREQDGKPERNSLLVIGGSGFVGSALCKAAVELGSVRVVSLSRSGLTPGLQRQGQSWVDSVDWVRGDVLQPAQWDSVLASTSAVVSCVGAFGSREHMLQVNGEANALAARAAAEAGVGRFVFVSAHDFGLVGRIIPAGYYEGKKAAEVAIRESFPTSSVVLYPGMVHGPRIVGNYVLPLQLVGRPLQAVFAAAPFLERLPVLGPAMVPPVPVDAVGRAAVKAALDEVGGKQSLSVWEILQFGQAP